MARSVARLASLEAGVVIVMNPGSPLAPGMTVAPDPSASAPNSFTFSGTYDGNGNGQAETTLDGRVTYVNDPTDFSLGFNGATGTVGVGIDILGGLMHVYRGNMAYTMGMAEHRFSGGGTFTNPMTGTTTTMTVNPAQPVSIKVADGTANARSNACAHSMNGQAQFSVAGPTGALASLWRFAYDSTTVAVTGASFTNTAGQTTVLPDSQVDLGCSPGGSINDWAGRFRIQWSCLPRETGEFNTTITVKNSTTLTMIDDGDTPAEAYEASLIGASPRTIRGFFIDGPMGNRFREDFNWTLSFDGNGFSQTSRYVYFEGLLTGRGGICSARATRL
jgi:YD repeat-containing protein